MSKKSKAAPTLPMIVPASTDNKDEARRGVALVLTLLLAGFALFNLGQGARGVIRNLGFVNAGLDAQGRVLRINTTIEPRLGGLGTRSISNAVVEFVSGGQTITFTNPSDCGTRCPQPGDALPISYDANNPNNALINTFASVGGPWLQNFIFSIMALAGAAVAFLYTKPPRKDLPRR